MTLRILAITNIYPCPDRPWLGTFVEQQVTGLQSVGVEVKVLYFNRKKEGPVIYYRMGSTIAQALAAFQPHLLHVMYGGVMADRITRRAWSVPAVVTFHGSDLLGENLSGRWRKLISRFGIWSSWRAARRASGVVVVARHLEKALPEDVDRRKIRVIPCGIDMARFKPMDQEACRQKLGWAAGTFHVLFPANTGDPVKRPWLAQAAVQALNKQHGVKVELHILSGVPYADVPLWINGSDALILTSLHEGSPMVVKEALACAVPVVSVDVGDVAERIAGIDGCHLVGTEPGDIARGLLAVWRRKRRVDSTNFNQALSIGTIAERLKDFYGELLQRPAARPAPELAEREAL
jgi:teichuronic acid biosynthesis glycosyltransferase TuaC